VIESGKEKPDLVLLDVMMPKLSGLEVCTAIRKKYKLTELPVIMLTAKNRPQDFVAGFEVGANDYIPKPFDKKELLNRIKVHLELSRTQNELKKLNKELEQKVYERTSQLQLSNEELEQANEELEQTNEELEATLNQLKETQNNMIMQEKMASLGSLTAGIAHEIKNPLNFINNFAKLSYDITKSADELVNNRKEELNTKDYEQLKSYIERLNKIVSRICEHGDRANNIVHSMLLHFHGGKEEKFRININDIVREYSKLAYHGIKTNYSDIMIDIEYNFDDNIEPVKLVPSEMGRVILNITNNACYEVFEKKKKSANPYYKPEINIKTTDTNDYIEIELADNGNGISDNIIDKIYEPFFTTKPPGVGTGLGLSISYDIIVNRYKGEIRIETRKEDGTKVIISLPKQS
ncbi:MAG: response regulator, partial [Spirochaetota bacterium]